jgi:DNA-binding CsgD family transcriptional regulator
MRQDALLELIGEVHGLLELAEFRGGLVVALRRAVPADWVSLNDIGPDPQSTAVVIEPAFPPQAHAVFARLAHQNPLIVRYQQTGDGRAYRFSDVITQRELRALTLYREFYGPLGLEHQIAFTLPSRPGRLLGVALSRRRDDFSASEQGLLNRARPFLIQAYRNAIAHSELVGEVARRRPPLVHVAALPRSIPALRALGLTPREAEIVQGTALGKANATLAAELEISERTVQKHLERCYRKLAVSGRSQAAGVVWSLAAGRSAAEQAEPSAGVGAG